MPSTLAQRLRELGAFINDDGELRIHGRPGPTLDRVYEQASESECPTMREAARLILRAMSTAANFDGSLVRDTTRKAIANILRGSNDD
ncbi:MAG: hypothetical protein AAGD32_06670 [Planctomycetota bacterium]